MTDEAIRMPEDAGEYAEQLRKLLQRIPELWGRQIDVSAGWYPIIIELDEALTEIDPAYELHQVKQKFAGLRFYFHSAVEDVERMRELVREAEAKAAVTCELCGEPGTRHLGRYGGVTTVCAACAAAKGYRPENEEVQELVSGMRGMWRVSHVSGSAVDWDIGFDDDIFYTRMTDGTAPTKPGDGQEVQVTEVLSWPRVGESAVVQLETGEVRTTSTVTTIRRVR